MVFSSGGNVGIGTADPIAPLELSKNQPWMRFSDNQTSGKKVDLMNGYPTAGKFSLWTNDTPGYLMTVVTANGNVGIGTTSPSAKLHVEGGSVIGSASSNATLLASKTTGGLDVMVGNGTKAFQIWDDAVLTTPRFVVERGGNVGIGTASP